MIVKLQVQAYVCEGTFVLVCVGGCMCVGECVYVCACVYACPARALVVKASLSACLWKSCGTGFFASS